MAEDFLKKLSDSLKTGEKNEELVEHLNEINEKASKMSGQDAAQKMDDRIKEVGEISEVDEEERKEAEQEYAEILAEQKENDEKLRLLANIIEDFETTKKKYSKLIAEIQETKITLMGDFEAKYGEKATDAFDFGPEPNTELD